VTDRGTMKVQNRIPADYPIR